jgi:predicted MFS family arabinose efflux permease
MTYAQRLSPDRAGLASGVFGSVFGVGVVAGNLIGSAGVPFLGIPHIFFIPALLCAISLVTFAGIERVSRQRKERDHDPAAGTCSVAGWSPSESQS